MICPVSLVSSFFIILRSAYRELVVRYLRTKMEEQANRDKCAVYFSVFDLKVFKHYSFVIDVVYMNKFPSLFFYYYSEGLHCVCHVPEVSEI